MKNLSLCMIVKNEEENIENCLKNAKIYADEIIIVDTGSTDKTKDIARKYTDKIFDFEWVHDFSKARNYAFSMASNQYLMWLDADDFLPEKTVQEILKWKKEEDECDVLICPYVTSYNENLSIKVDLVFRTYLFIIIYLLLKHIKDVYANIKLIKEEKNESSN